MDKNQNIVDLFRKFYKEFTNISFEERKKMINSLDDYEERIILNKIDNVLAEKAQAKVIADKQW